MNSNHDSPEIEQIHFGIIADKTGTAAEMRTKIYFCTESERRSWFSTARKVA